MNGRAAATCLLVPIAYLLNQLAWMGARSVIGLHAVQERGLDMAAANSLFAAMRGYGLVGIVLAGAIAAAVGPRWVFVGALAVSAVGHALLQTTAVPLPVGAGLMAFGSGAALPCVYAIAAELFADPDEHRRAGFAALLVLAMNVADLFSPLFGGFVVRLLGSRLLFVGLAAVAATALLAGAIAAPLRVRRPIQAVPFDWRPLAGAAVLVAANAPYVLLLGLSMRLQYSGAFDAVSQVASWITPLVVALVVSMIAVVMFVLGGSRARPRTVVLAGAGMVVAGLGALLPLPFIGRVTLIASMVVMAIAEAFVTSLLVARLAGGQHWRLATAVVAVYALSSRLLSVAAFPPQGDLSSSVAVPVAAAAVATLVAGAALVVVDLVARKHLWPQTAR